MFFEERLQLQFLKFAPSSESEQVYHFVTPGPGVCTRSHAVWKRLLSSRTYNRYKGVRTSSGDANQITAHRGIEFDPLVTAEQDRGIWCPEAEHSMLPLQSSDSMLELGVAIRRSDRLHDSGIVQCE